MPLVTCIMSNYNTDITMLCASIESVLGQTLSDFEFIIVDDCSTDNSTKVLENYAELDERIVLLKNESNRGLAYSLNRGISIAKGNYIARMDSDDIAFPNRFHEQVVYLDKHSDIDVLGTFAKTFGDVDGFSFSPFISKDECKCQILFTPCLIHPTVMIRKSFLDKFNLLYDIKYLCSQDFDMWARCSEVGNISMLDKVLLRYRIHGAQTSMAKKELQRQYTIDICQRQLAKMKIKVAENDIKCHLVICGKEPLTVDIIDDVISWGNKIIFFNSKKKIYNDLVLRRIVYNRIFNLLIKSNFKKSLVLKIILLNKELRSFSNLYSVAYRVVFLAKNV